MRYHLCLFRALYVSFHMDLNIDEIIIGDKVQQNNRPK